MTPPDDAPQTGQTPPWDLGVIHEIQTIVYDYYYFHGKSVPEHISAQIDDFIAMGMAYGLTPPEPKEGGAS